METLTYSYGETPEEVIVERWGAFVDGFPAQTFFNTWLRSFPDEETLLGVLDNAHYTYVKGIAESAELCRAGELGSARERVLLANHAAKQRKEILAALGIDEG